MEEKNVTTRRTGRQRQKAKEAVVNPTAVESQSTAQAVVANANQEVNNSAVSLSRHTTRVLVGATVLPSPSQPQLLMLSATILQLEALVVKQVVHKESILLAFHHSNDLLKECRGASASSASSCGSSDADVAPPVELMKRLQKALANCESLCNQACDSVQSEVTTICQTLRSLAENANPAEANPQSQDNVNVNDNDALSRIAKLENMCANLITSGASLKSELETAKAGMAKMNGAPTGNALLMREIVDRIHDYFYEQSQNKHAKIRNLNVFVPTKAAWAVHAEKLISTHFGPLAPPLTPIEACNDAAKEALGFNSARGTDMAYAYATLQKNEIKKMLTDPSDLAMFEVLCGLVTRFKRTATCEFKSGNGAQKRSYADYPLMLIS